MRAICSYGLGSLSKVGAWRLGGVYKGFLVPVVGAGGAGAGPQVAALTLSGVTALCGAGREERGVLGEASVCMGFGKA